MNSEQSESVVVGIKSLASPTLTRDGDYISWTEVVGAELYVIYANGFVAGMVQANGETKINFRSTYNLKFASTYPNGVMLTIVACAAGLEDSPHSNEVLYS